MILMSVGIANNGLENLMTPKIGNNVFLLIVYTLCGMLWIQKSEIVFNLVSEKMYAVVFFISVLMFSE